MQWFTFIANSIFIPSYPLLIINPWIFPSSRDILDIAYHQIKDENPCNKKSPSDKMENSGFNWLYYFIVTMGPSLIEPIDEDRYRGTEVLDGRGEGNSFEFMETIKKLFFRYDQKSWWGGCSSKWCDCGSAGRDNVANCLNYFRLFAENIFFYQCI